MSRLPLIKTFVQVVENNGFSKAAQKLGVTTPAISKQIAKLETKLNARLFTRTTRQITLTETGKIYYGHCRRILETIDESERAISQYHAEPMGKLRIVSGRYFAEKYIIPYLVEFTARYQKVVIDIEVAERTPDLSKEHIDILFGSINFNSPDLIKKQITTSHFVTCTSPDYLHQYGTPTKPGELINHIYITHSMRKTNNILEFKGNQQVHVIPKFYFNDARSMLQAAIAGAGIISLHNYIVTDAISQRLLIPILQEYSLPKQKIYLFYQKHRYLEPKIRRFIDFILGKIL